MIWTDLPKPDSIRVSNDGGIALRYHFDNGYEASVLRSSFSIGHEYNLWELAVLKDGDLTYETPITSDVLGNLDAGEVINYLNQIEELSGEQ